MTTVVCVTNNSSKLEYCVRSISNKLDDREHVTEIYFALIALEIGAGMPLLAAM